MMVRPVCEAELTSVVLQQRRQDPRQYLLGRVAQSDITIRTSMEDSLYRSAKLVVEQSYLYFHSHHDCHHLGRRCVSSETECQADD
jgi:hypothetical protein